MITVSVTDNLKEITQGLDDIAKKQMPFATRRAINETAKLMASDGNKLIASVFDRPIKRTVSSVKVFQGATKDRMFAVVNIYDGQRGFSSDDPRALASGKSSVFPNKYLSAEIEGGHRANKRFENALIKAGAMPQGMQAVFAKRSGYLDVFGNLPSAKIIQILSWFQAFPETGYRANTTQRAKQKALLGTKNKRTGETRFAKGRKYGYGFFVSAGERYGGLGMRLPAGIWERNYPNGPSGDTFIKPVLLFVKPGNYQRRLDFYGEMSRSYDAHMTVQLKAAMDHAIRTAK